MHLMTAFVQGHRVVLRIHTELIICKSVLLKIMFAVESQGNVYPAAALKHKHFFFAKTCKMPQSVSQAP